MTGADGESHRGDPATLMATAGDASGMDPERVVFLGVAFATHGIVGYALVRSFTDARPATGFLLALVPDVDLLFPATWGAPFVHRGITHTPAFVLTVAAAAYAIHRENAIALAVGLAAGSHLAIDSLSPKGVMWLFPLEVRASPGLPVHGPAITLLLWTFAVAIVIRDERDPAITRDPQE